MRLIDDPGAGERPSPAVEAAADPARSLERHPPASPRHRALAERLLLTTDQEQEEQGEGRDAVLGGLARAVRLAEVERGSVVRVRWSGARPTGAAAPRPPAQPGSAATEVARRPRQRKTKEGKRDG